MNLRSVLGLAALSLLVGCKMVYVSEPIGDQPVQLAGRNDVAGTWTWDNGAVAVRVSDAAKGELELGWIDTKKDGFALRTTKAFARERNGLVWITVQTSKGDDPDAKDPKGPMCYFGAVRLEGDHGWLFYPDWRIVGERVQAGKLPGKVDGDGDVILGKLSMSQTDTLTTVGMLLWERPFPLKKLGK